MILLGLSGSQMLKAAEKLGLKAKKEVFADRAYEEDGTLVARTKTGAMILNEDEAIERVLGMIKFGKGVVKYRIPIQYKFEKGF